MANENTALAKVEAPGALARPYELSVEDVVERVEKIQAIAKKVMKEGHHFGTIPGVDKPSLLKPGAEILCQTFQLAPSFKLKEKRSGDHLEVIATCKLTASNGAVLGSADGSCSTRESKYAFRNAARVCPECGEPAIIKGKEQYGGGWLCWNKPEKGKNGCGAKFKDGDRSIEDQVVGRIENPDLPDTWNTVRKMAEKRALVAIVLIVTCASDLFTQDVEEQGRKEEPEQPDKPKAAPAKGTTKPVVVPTDKDVDTVIELIRGATTVSQLDGIIASNKNRRWSRSQIATLNTADQERREELELDAAGAYGGGS